MKTHLIKEYLSFSQNVLEFRQLEEVPLQGFSVLVHLTELIFELFEGCLDKRKTNAHDCNLPASMQKRTGLSTLLPVLLCYLKKLAEVSMGDNTFIQNPITLLNALEYYISCPMAGKRAASLIISCIKILGYSFPGRKKIIKFARHLRGGVLLIPNTHTRSFTLKFRVLVWINSFASNIAHGISIFDL